MSSSTTGRVLGLLLLLCGCGVELEPPSVRTKAAITGGEVDDGDLAVVSLQLSGGGGCSGTLISPRMILTAAHCDMESPLYGTASFGTLINAPLRKVEIIDSIRNPMSDIRLAKLAIPIGDIAPIPINRVPLSFSQIGQPLRHVGFGLDAYPKGGVADTKRQVSLTINAIRTNEIIFSSDNGLKGVCFGDSGGPGLLRTDAGTDEVVVGVASYLVSQPACYGAAADVRVDAFAAWIDEVLAVWELKSCEPGDACKPDCVPVDPDCFCVHDAFCDLRCPKLSLDPDCEPECGSDGVCSGAVCPFRDPDCVAPGSTCTQDSQCQSRTCATQAGKRFCSRGCATIDQCPVSMYCSATNHVCLFRPLLAAACDAALPCGEGLCVSEPDGGQACRSTCETSARCPPEQQCLATSNTPGICRDRPPVTPPPPKKQGCAAAPGQIGLLALLAVLRRRKLSSR